jgi:hypothetical protein
MKSKRKNIWAICIESDGDCTAPGPAMHFCNTTLKSEIVFHGPSIYLTSI